MTGLGRPRNPDIDRRVVDSALTILAVQRMPGFKTDEIAAHARVGKAAIYRRWRSGQALLVDVVRELGPREVDFGGWNADLTSDREDLIAVLTAACTGIRALAEAAVLPHIGLHDDLRAAYYTGPAQRLTDAGSTAAIRAATRGNVWLSLNGVRAGHALLMHNIQVSGLQPPPGLILAVANTVLRSLHDGLTPMLRRSAVETDTPSTAGSLTPGGTA